MEKFYLVFMRKFMYKMIVIVPRDKHNKQLINSL